VGIASVLGLLSLRLIQELGRLTPFSDEKYEYYRTVVGNKILVYVNGHTFGKLLNVTQYGTSTSTST